MARQEDKHRIIDTWLTLPPALRNGIQAIVWSATGKLMVST